MPDAPTPTQTPTPNETLADRYAAVMGALVDRPPLTIAELAANLGWPEGRVNAVICDLNVHGRIRVEPGRRRGRQVNRYTLR